MAWLDDWSKRIKITIDKDQVDGDLENFPSPIYLSASSGQSNDDVSAIFDELTSDANRKKIAVTDADGTTELYVEIERWVDADEEAWLHVKVPSISASVDGTLYIYYDSSKADNTTYVGDVGSTPGQAVWDSNFKAVYHLGEAPTGGSGCVKDSTSNGNDGTPGGSMIAGDLVDGKFGKGLDFDGSDDEVDLGQDTFTDAQGTIEACVKFVNLSQHQTFFAASDNTDLANYMKPEIINTGYFRFQHEATNYVTGNTLLSAGTFYYTAVISNGSAWTLYVNDILQSLTVGGFNNGNWFSDLPTGDHDIWIGRWERSTSSRSFNGVIDEVRVSSIARTAAWLKATYEGLWDDLLVFGTQELLPPLFYYEGYVTVESTPATRVINLYKRDTGGLIDSTTSSGSGGYFSLESPYDDYHFVVVLPNLSENYAILTDDKIHPTGGN